MSETHETHEQEARELLASRIAEMRTYLDAGEGTDCTKCGEFVTLDSSGEWWDQFGDAICADGTEDDPNHSADLDTELLDGYEDATEAVANYGLEWSKATTNHREGTVTYVHVLSTGGPHDEFQVTFAGDKVDDWKFVYLPWFDRVEITSNPYELSDSYEEGEKLAETVVDFYETFYGELVQMDNDEHQRG